MACEDQLSPWLPACDEGGGTRARPSARLGRNAKRVLKPEEVPDEVVQDAVEDLGLILGKMIEVKMNANSIKARLNN